MKILFIHHSGLIGGAGVSLINTIEALAQTDEIVLTLPSEPTDMQKLAENHGIPAIITERRIGAITYVSGIDHFLSPRFLYRFILMILQFFTWNKRIKNLNPDLVIVNSKTLCWMSLLPAVRARNSICFVRETMQGDITSLPNQMINSLLNRFSEVVFISEYDRDLENLKNVKHRVIHNYVTDLPLVEPWVLEEKRRAWNLSADRFRVLYVGGVSQMKGFHIAVQAILEMGRDVDLIAAGNTIDDIMQTGNPEAMKFASQMKEYLATQDLNHQIHLIGRQQDMAPCYQMCDVLIFPMQSPHQARPVFEAGYFEKPVIISDYENIREFVIDGYNGFAVEADNIEQYVKSLSKLKQNPKLRNQMGKNNHEKTQVNHNPSVVQSQIREMIGEYKK